MRTAGVVPNVPDVATFNSMDFKKAEEVFEKTMYQPFSIKKVEEIFEWMREAGMVLNGVTFSNLIHACTENGEIKNAEAKSFIKEMAEAIVERMKSAGVLTARAR